jgi:anti-sigma regulatory factor (Ser/Thr protein kinase)
LVVLTEERMASLRLPATSGASRLARGAVENVPELHGYPDLQYVTALLTTELVSNAVRHGGLSEDDQVGLVVDADAEAVHVEVTDSGCGFFPLPLTRSRPGRRLEHGLHLMDVLADRWGFRCDSHGCCLWFDLDLVPGRRPWRGRLPVPGRMN